MVIACPLAIAQASSQKVLTVTFPYQLSQDINHEDYYFSQLLRLALDKTVAQEGPWTYRSHSYWMRDKRLRIGLTRGFVDVIWSPASDDFEQQLLAIKVPLLKGLSQYRLLLIHEDDQTRFDKIDSLEQLAALTGGMGSQWPDVSVMEVNGLKLLTVPGYGRLFKMLAARRFDYFSRGIYQIQSEVDFYPSLPLAIEKHLLLKQPGAYYFYVTKENHALADRIGRGLKLAHKDGSFDELFSSIPRYRWAYHELERRGRTLLELKTP